MNEPVRGQPADARRRELEDRLFALLFGDPRHRETAITRLLADNPEHADALRAHCDAHHALLGHPSSDGALEQVVPGYRLIGMLGEGGMGCVYRAEQLEPRRVVALKVIKAGLDRKAVLARFEMEWQALAAMDHAAIAKVFGCGTTVHGRPFFAMEFVAGQPLVEYCDRHRLSLWDRLRLFQQVCAGVQHAHQKGVIHRDLKPANILVSEGDGRPLPKIIDFGVARAADPTGAGGTLLTEPGIVLGTPEYMSPEQASGEVAKVDTRSDVYTLGVVLYELLIGALPFPSAALRAAGLAEIQRQLREVEPPLPSRRLTTLGELATRCADARAIDVTALRRELAHDLDWIVARAMAKEPERRYASAQALAEDIDRYLHNEPVLAGPPSARHRLRKLVRRHRTAAIATAVVCATVLVSAVLVVQFALRERQKVREFDMVSAAVQYEPVLARARDLYPAWPPQIEAMEKWLREDCPRLLAMRPLLTQTLHDLQARALPLTAARQREDRESHPRFAELQTIDAIITAQQRADRVRAGATLVPRTLTEEQAGFPWETLDAMAWDRVAPDWHERKVVDDCALGLACANAAVAKATGTADEAKALVTLAWAYFGNGLDARARQCLDDAASKAGANRAEWIARQRTQLLAAVEGVATAGEHLREERARLDAEVSERRTWELPADDAGGTFLPRAIRESVANLQHLAMEDMPDVERRLAWARQLAALKESRRNGPTWDDVRAALRKADDVVASRLYAGQDIPLRDDDLWGLVPIGMNPVTRLWEFYDLRSAWDGKQPAGDIPIPSHESDGSIPVGDATGIVFVLLPGAEARIGGTAEHRFGPVHTVPLAPFLLARHELTQGQWTRLWNGPAAQRNPSQNKAGSTNRGETFTWSHPVEQVDWPTACRVLAEAGMVLPTEAQWEYACRAGAKGPWWCEREELWRVANLADQTAKEAGVSWAKEAVNWRDGFALCAPVGSLAANPFGLYDVHGNVGEWCLDEYLPYTNPFRAGDGLRGAGDGTGDRVIRGGCCGELPGNATAAFRRRAHPSLRNDYVGVRAARRLRGNG